MKFKTLYLLIAGILLGIGSMPAQANNEAMLVLIKVLHDKGSIDDQEYELLMAATKADQEVSEATQAEVKAEVEKVAATAAEIPKITTKGKIKIESNDGSWSFQPIGRVMWDAINTDEDGSGIEDFKGTELRRARLGFQGSIYDYGYKLEVDFAGGDASIKDVYLSYNTKFGNTKAGLKLGQSHMPFGLNTKISSKYMSFMDRPLFADSTISPARGSGAVASWAASDYRWLLGAGLTNGSIKDGSTDDIGSTFSVRGSFVPFRQDKTHLVQLGAGYLTQGTNGDTVKFEQRLVSHKDRTKHLKTSVAAHDGSDAFSIDALGVFGSFHAMAEYVDYTLEDKVTSDIDIDGYAVEAGYFITGESLKWKKGYTSGITPMSSAGAWQIVARFESVEIDEAGAKDEADKFTIGINYYPTQNTRLMFNYDKVTDLTINGIKESFEPSALKFRAQAYW